MDCYDYVDTDLVSVSLPKTSMRNNGRLSCIDSKNTFNYAAPINFAEPVILPKVTRQKSNLRRTSNHQFCDDAKKKCEIAARYRIRTFDNRRKYKVLMTKKIKQKCYDQHDEKCEAKKRRTDVNGRESSGKSSQAETEQYQKRVKVDEISNGGKMTSCDFLLESYFLFGFVP